MILITLLHGRGWKKFDSGMTIPYLRQPSEHRPGLPPIALFTISTKTGWICSQNPRWRQVAAQMNIDWPTKQNEIIGPLCCASMLMFDLLDGPSGLNNATRIRPLLGTSTQTRTQRSISLEQTQTRFRNRDLVHLIIGGGPLFTCPKKQEKKFSRDWKSVWAFRPHR